MGCPDTLSKQINRYRQISLQQVLPACLQICNNKIPVEMSIARDIKMVESSVTCKPVVSISSTAEPYGLTALGPNCCAGASVCPLVHSLVHECCMAAGCFAQP